MIINNHLFMSVVSNQKKMEKKVKITWQETQIQATHFIISTTTIWTSKYIPRPVDNKLPHTKLPNVKLQTKM